MTKMESSTDFKSFLQNIYLKVCIAVAISIIRSKPTNLSLNEYVENIQNACLREWQNTNEVVSFENRIISVQRNNVLKVINNLLPSCSYQDDSDLGSEEWFPSITDDIKLPKTFDGCDSSSDNESLADDNAEFMRALIKLKFAVNSRKTLILKRSNSTKQTNLSLHSLKEIEPIPNKTFSNEIDSGLASIETSANTCEYRSFSTSLLRYVTNSSKTDIIVEKCLQTVFNYIKNSLTKHAVICFNYWKDSILENIFNILKEVSFDGICSDAIISFLESVLESIWNSEDINKHIDWEYQCIMLNELCCTLIICENTLKFLINKLNTAVEKVNEMKTTLLKTSDQYLIEKMPHFIDMTSVLLLKWKRFYDKQTKSSSNNLDNNEPEKAITNIWKKKWNVELDNIESEENMIKNWKETFEKLIVCTTKNYPLISLMTVDLVNVVDSLLADSVKLNNANIED
ncbi:uncharacterized protein [Rhodnius prolixus]